MTLNHEIPLTLCVLVFAAPFQKIFCILSFFSIPPNFLILFPTPSFMPCQLSLGPLASSASNASPQTVEKQGSCWAEKNSSGNPILQGNLNSSFASSFMPGSFAPPPVRTMPAGSIPNLEIFLSSLLANSKISETLASIIFDNIFLEKNKPSSPSNNIFFSDFFPFCSDSPNFLQEPNSNFIFSAALMSVLRQIAISFVIFADPTGKTATCINPPSSKTDISVDPAPMSKTQTPNSFSLSFKTALLEAMAEGISP